MKAHFDLEQWAQKQGGRKKKMEIELKKTIPEFVVALVETSVLLGEDLSTETGPSMAAAEPE